MTLISQLLGVPPPPDPTGAPTFKPGKENDRWNASRLGADAGDEMIFVNGKGWGLWDGGRFDFLDGAIRAFVVAERLQGLVEADARDARIEDYSEFEVRRRLADEIAKVKPAFATPEEALDALRSAKAAALEKHATKCGNVDKMEKTLKVMQGRKRVALADLDSDPWSFTLPNGRLDLRAAAEAEITPNMTRAQVAEVRAQWLQPHDRALYPTKCAGVEFDPGADCPEWRAFLDLVLPDPAVRDCFHRAMGVTLFGKNEPQCAFLFRGAGGNGKSTAVNAVAYVLGESSGYAVPCRIEMFLTSQNESAGKATPEEVDIPGARVLIASEPSPTDELSMKKIKSLTGGDPRPARALNMPQFYYRPTAFPILSFNRTPRIKDEDEGSRRRLVFFPFEVNLTLLPEDQKRSSVKVAAALKAEGPGILNWMLDGWREYRRRADAGIGKPAGIDPPESMIELKEALLSHADPIGEFIKDCCTVDPAVEGIRTSHFFKVYADWCEMTGSALYGKQAVTRILQEKGVRVKKGGGGIRFWSGLRWQETDNVDALLTAANFAPAPRGLARAEAEVEPDAPF